MIQPKSHSTLRPKRDGAIQLRPSLDKRLVAYIVTASATVGAAGRTANAEVIYTPAHVQIHETYLLDLNRDGLPDFDLKEIQYCSAASTLCYEFLDANPVGQNAVAGTKFAGALPTGSEIGPGRRFGGAYLMAKVTYIGSASAAFGGPWANGGKGVKNLCLGLRFLIKGETHYGWARLTVTTTSHNFTTLLTGYAYETVPNLHIYAGVAPVPEFAGNFEEPGGSSENDHKNHAANLSSSLGLLARGARATMVRAQIFDPH